MDLLRRAATRSARKRAAIVPRTVIVNSPYRAAGIEVLKSQGFSALEGLPMGTRCGSIETLLTDANF